MSNPIASNLTFTTEGNLIQSKHDFDESKVIWGEKFEISKMTDVFWSVVFKYKDYVWDGAIPIKLESHGIELTDEEVSERVVDFYKSIDPLNRDKWIKESDSRWKKKNKTYKVLEALYSGEWVCRVHGDASKNAQAAARIGALKTDSGYVIASKRIQCKVCEAKTVHDLLVMIPFFENRFEHGNEMRKPMSEKFKKRVKNIFTNVDACTNRVLSGKQLIIDHKFPSQRWNKPESDNPNDMSEAKIRGKFQLLSNQNNLQKSRYCDRCVKEGVRGDFMGINWFYEGDEKWRAANDDEKGCIGCPWYDMAEWKKRLMASLRNNQPASV